jgi:cytosine/adenosine deaminase-related metal-dependent hydrolase
LSAQLLRARIVWPVSTPPIENGAVCIRDGVIEDVGPWTDLSRRWTGIAVEDLGEVALMPGLVNAHCHLDYTGMASMIPAPSSSLNFPDWIKSMLSLKAHWSYTEFAASWLKGAKQLLDSGCTTVFDIEAVPELLPEAWNSTPLRVISLLEMTGVRSGHQPERILRDANQQRQRIGETARCKTGLSPHALYSTPPALLKLVAEKMRAEKIPIAIHLAESEAEWEMYQNARGPLYDWLKSQRPMDDCGGRSPIQHAHELGLLQPNLLAIHCNYLAPGDAELLAKNQVTVVHCPRSHAFFKHAPFPYGQLRAASVNIVIATDSLASIEAKKNNLALNLREELRQFTNHNHGIDPNTIVQMVTTNLSQIPSFVGGHLANGSAADLIWFRFDAAIRDLGAYAICENLTVDGRLIGGEGT